MSQLAQDITPILNAIMLLSGIYLFTRQDAPTRGEALIGVLSGIVGVWYYIVLKMQIFEHPHELSRWRSFAKDAILFLYLLGALQTYIKGRKSV